MCLFLEMCVNMHMNVGMTATSTLGAVHPILLKQSFPGQELTE